MRIAIIILVLVSMAFSCKKEEVKPIETGNDVCKCGTIQFTNMYAPFTEYTFTIKNDCTGNVIDATGPTYNAAGNKMCLNYTW